MKFSAAASVLVLILSAHCYAQKELVLVLEDNFDDFNLSLWKHELTLGGGGNFEFQWYDNDRSNSFTEDGVLHINPTLTSDDLTEQGVMTGSLNIWGAQPADLCTGNAFFGCERNAGQSGNYINPIKSARIRTAESFSFTYGKVEVRAKLPRGDWLWPAIWLLPTDNQYGVWPKSGEIDIMESRGNPPSYAPGGYDTFGSTLHWGLNSNQNQWPRTHQLVPEEKKEDFTSDFHVYGLIWNKTYIGTYLDTESNPILQVPISQSFFGLGGWNSSVWFNPWRGRGDSAPFDRRFFLILNLAVGGSGGYFPDGFGKPWNDSSATTVNEFYDARNEWLPTWTQSFQIDSVRVWAYQDREVTDSPSTTSSALFSLFNGKSVGIVMLSILLSITVYKLFG